MQLLKEMDPRANPFEFGGLRASALLIHGFTGTCAEMRPIGEMISKEFHWNVLAPLLPGHGTTLADLDTKKWTDWLETVETSWHSLQKKGEPVHLVGLSMGALLCLELFRRNPNAFASLSLLVPPVWLKTWFQRIATELVRCPVLAAIVPPAPKSTPNHVDHVAYAKYSPKSTAQFSEVIKQTHSLQPMDAPPTFICFSDADEVVNPKSAQFLAERLKSHPQCILHLTHSTHVVSIGEEKEKLFQAMKSFYREANA